MKNKKGALNELALFAGSGGGNLGGHLLGWKTVCAVEIEKYPRDVLLARQRDGIFPRFPIWDDIKTFDGRPWKGRVNIVTGGFPCQDISCAGKGKGITGEKSGLWKEMGRVVRETEPEFVFVENSPMLTSRGLGIVLGDLAEMGYDARWCVLGANDAGAPHQRKRIWILAYSESERIDRKSGNDNEKKRKDGNRTNKFNGRGKIKWWDIDPAELPDTDQLNDDMGGFGTSEVQQSEQTKVSGCEIPDATETGLQDRTEKKTQEKKRLKKSERLLRNSKNWPTKSRLGRVVNGMAHRVDRLKAIGNGQVPAVAALAFIILSDGLI